MLAVASPAARAMVSTVSTSLHRHAQLTAGSLSPQDSLWGAAGRNQLQAVDTMWQQALQCLDRMHSDTCMHPSTVRTTHPNML